MQRVEIVREMIRQHAIPRSTVAKLSGLWLTDLSAWLNGKRDIPADRIARVQETVEDIVKVIMVLPFADLRDPEKVRKMIVVVNDALLQHGLFDDADAEPDFTTLRIRDINETPA